MKFFPIMLINIVTVVLALVVYDFLQDDSATKSPGRAGTARSTADAELAARLHALEVQTRDLQDAQGAEMRRAEDGRASKVAEQTDRAAADLVGTEQEQARGKETPALEADSEEPTEAEVRRFRMLQKAVRRHERIEKNRKRVDAAVDKLGVNLTEKQREQVHAAAADFEPNVNRIWGEVKQEARATVKAGGEVDRGQIISTTMTRIQTEFAATLTDVVGHQADAQAIAQALHPSSGK